MEILPGNNRAEVKLKKGDTYFFKPAILKGFVDYDWRLIPPHWSGSPFLRIIHRNYFLIKEVSCVESEKAIPLTGYYPRGSFYSLTVGHGEHYCVNIRNLVGFSGNIRSIHTHIKLQPVYWCLREHFFSVFEGPGTILFYSKSPIEPTENHDFDAARILAFDIKRRFTVVAPQPRSAVSWMLNIFSDAIVWRFIDSGTTIADSHIEPSEAFEKPSFSELLSHFLGLFKF